MPSLDLAAALHAERHAAGGPDPITPEAIGAASLTHASRHAANGSDPITPASIGALLDNGGIYSDHADNLTISGAYYIKAGSLTAENGWPWMRGAIGVVTVARSNGPSYLSQDVIDDSGNRWHRLLRGSTWYSWRPIATLIGASGFGPEGVVAAPVGSEYADTNASNGARKWYKASGDSSTGWIVVDGDTGWRTIPLENGWTGLLKIRRTDAQVSVVATGLDSSAATSSNMFQLPLGFYPGPGLPARGLAHQTNGNSATVNASIGAVGGGSNQIVRASYGSGWSGGSASLMFTTSDSWPSTLPGTPA